MSSLQLLSYPRHLLPRQWACQVRSFVRVQWPFLHADSDRIWFDPAPGVDARREPVHFMLVAGELLISHAVANFREVEHRGERYVVGGLSTVFTFPAHRKSGAGREVVRAATEHLCGSDADLAMLFCGEPLRGFYTSCGWSSADRSRIHFGDPNAPTLKSDNLVMMMFLSERGRAAREAFESEGVYVGPTTW
jgi:hypothetical protein